MQTASSKKTVNPSPHNLSHAHSEESFILLFWKACGSLRTCDRGQVRPLKNIFFKVWYPNSRLSFLSKCILTYKRRYLYWKLRCWTEICQHTPVFPAELLPAPTTFASKHPPFQPLYSQYLQCHLWLNSATNSASIYLRPLPLSCPVWK